MPLSRLSRKRNWIRPFGYEQRGSERAWMESEADQDETGQAHRWLELSGIMLRGEEREERRSQTQTSNVIEFGRRNGQNGSRVA